MRQEVDKWVNINLLQRGKSVTASHRLYDYSGILVRLITRRDFQLPSEGHMPLKLHIKSQILQSTIN